MAKAPKAGTKSAAKPMHHTGKMPMKGKMPMPMGGPKGAKAALFQPKGGRGMVAPPARKAK